MSLCPWLTTVQGRPNFKNALAQTYSPLLAHEIDPVTEVAVTTGANEGMLSIIAAFVEPGEEIIVLEPFFDQCVSLRRAHAEQDLVLLTRFYAATGIFCRLS